MGAGLKTGTSDKVILKKDILSAEVLAENHGNFHTTNGCPPPSSVYKSPTDQPAQESPGTAYADRGFPFWIWTFDMAGGTFSSHVKSPEKG